jgi:hypothetical protein
MSRAVYRTTRTPSQQSEYHGPKTKSMFRTKQEHEVASRTSKCLSPVKTRVQVAHIAGRTGTLYVEVEGGTPRIYRSLSQPSATVSPSSFEISPHQLNHTSPNLIINLPNPRLQHLDMPMHPTQHSLNALLRLPPLRPHSILRIHIWLFTLTGSSPSSFYFLSRNFDLDK